ncbi:unnamed protein product, partial [Laminaria digitata]
CIKTPAQLATTARGSYNFRDILPRVSTRSTSSSSAPAPDPEPAPDAPPPTSLPQPDRASAVFIPADTPLAETPCFARSVLGTAPVCDPTRVFTADGRSCEEGDRLEL